MTNDYDQFESDMAGIPLEEVEQLWQLPEDPFCLPAMNADEDY